jgi:hypothetical protein
MFYGRCIITVHMLYFCAWSRLPQRCLGVDQRRAVKRSALLPAVNFVFCLCKTQHSVPLKKGLVSKRDWCYVVCKQSESQIVYYMLSKRSQ